MTEKRDHDLHLARNIARFAGAAIASSLRDKNIMHVVVNLVALSLVETSALRGSIATRLGATKIPYLIPLN